ncbi:iron-sulfur cluster assembly accessory protein [Methanosarcina hadiensis]|uniref:HesB/IscA family protein n=1 Tax=Methanosarcina hadiensis TaxID=3078083 RepID=UPI0039774A06
MIEITDRAATELKFLLETEGIEQPAIRVYITGSTTDVQYGLAVADDINEFDVITENNGIKIVMSPDVAAGFSDGSIDFVVDGTSKNFIIQNADTGTCDNCEECNICDAE